jgi:hypothetical protein
MPDSRIGIADGSLVDVLDTLLESGVVVAGDAILGLADVDLVRLNLRLVVASVDALDSDDQLQDLGGFWGTPSGPVRAQQLEGHQTAAPPAGPVKERPAETPAREAPSGRYQRWTGGSPPAELANSRAQDSDLGVGALLLAVIDLVRQLLERQALHRMERGSLTDNQIERLGQALMALEQRVEQLAAYFRVRPQPHPADSIFAAPPNRRNVQ